MIKSVRCVENCAIPRLGGVMALFSDTAKMVIPCHVSSFTGAPSYTAVQSVLRLLAVDFSSREHESSSQRLQIIDNIHEELGDLY